jgi:hypothetical protein
MKCVYIMSNSHSLEVQHYASKTNTTTYKPYFYYYVNKMSVQNRYIKAGNVFLLFWS